MRFIKNLVFAFAVSLSLNAFSQDTLTGVDSVYNIIKGDWYAVEESGGIFGGIRPIYSEDLYSIERIPGTDSIVSNVFRAGTLISQDTFKIAFIQSMLYRSKKWCFTGNGLFGSIIEKRGTNYTSAIDAADGTTVEYSRTKRVKPSSDEVDSVFSFFTGDWYMVHGCIASTPEYCDSIESTEKNTFERIPGTDSVKWIVYENGVLKQPSKFKLEYALNSSQEYEWSFCINGLAYHNNIEKNNDNIKMYGNDPNSFSKMEFAKVPHIFLPPIDSTYLIDSIVNIINGDWYKVYECNGFSGQCDSVYSSKINRFERIAGTDSIVWTILENGIVQSKNSYKIDYLQSMTLPDHKWGLTQNGSLAYMIEKSGNNFSLSMDAADGGMEEFSRIERVKPVPPIDPIPLTVDSVYRLIKGIWYTVFRCSESGICDTIIGTETNNIKRVQATDSIIWKIVENGVQLSSEKYLIEYSNQLSCWTFSQADSLIFTIYVDSVLFSVKTVNGDSVGFSRKIVSGINSLPGTEEVKIFPNPCTNYIDLKDIGLAERINILDVYGKLLQSIVCNTINNQRLDISGYSAGIYIIQIVSDKSLKAIKVVKSVD